ncbi:MAG: M28 family peptidase [Arcicella sp.]|jgi:hypothetical protein|nr:M28 family peptidase [Arcicella sp.]
MKIKTIFLSVLLILGFWYSQAQSKFNQVPQILNLRVSNDTLKKELQITYDLKDVENEKITISLNVSNDNGQTFNVDIASAMGDIGKDIEVGNDKKIIWNYKNSSESIGNFYVKLVADDLFKINIFDLINQVDTVRLQKSVEHLLGNRYPATLDGMIGLTKARNYIVKNFTEQKLFIDKQEFSIGQYNTFNIFGKKLGNLEEQNFYILSANFDNQDKTKGSDDNSSGVAGLIEASRILSQYQFKKTVVFAGFDLKFKESTGCVKYIFEGGLKENEKMEGAICLDGISNYRPVPWSQSFPKGFELLFPEQAQYLENNQYKGDFILNVSNENSVSLMNEFDKNVKQFVPDLKLISLVTPRDGKLTPELATSDHVAFWYGKLKAIDINDTGYTRDKIILKNDNSSKKYNYAFASNVVKASIATIANLAEIQHAGVAYSKVTLFLASR